MADEPSSTEGSHVGGNVELQNGSTFIGRDLNSEQRADGASIAQAQGEGASANVTTVHEAPKRPGCYTQLGSLKFSLVLTVLLMVSLTANIGQIVGWSNIGRLISGTSNPEDDGYSCLPTCVENDGKFLAQQDENGAPLADTTIVVWIGAPIGQSSFEISIFDGDSGKDDEGNIQWEEGNWDDTETETIYTLYADPFRDGTGEEVVGRWFGNNVNLTADTDDVWTASSDEMPNNDWYNIVIKNVDAARHSDRKYRFYRLVCTRSIGSRGTNAFKLRSTGRLSSGRSELTGTSLSVAGILATEKDMPVIFPDYHTDSESLDSSTYDGEWIFYFYVPPGTKTISLWDGDFDRGTVNNDEDADTDDPNTTGKPSWARISAVNERAGGQGNPADDHESEIYRREPPVYYEFIGPDGYPIFVNEEPSGSDEWETFVVTADPRLPDEAVDLRVDRLDPGIYTLHIFGLDLNNTVWFYLNYSIDAESDAGYWECPICSEHLRPTESAD